jgi:hypothetical protein
MAISRRISHRRLFFSLCFVILSLLVFTSQYLFPSVRHSDISSRGDTLGLAANIFVISLPRRVDRRKEMEALREVLGLQWTYVDAIESTDEVVTKILDRVQSQRRTTYNETNDGHFPTQSTTKRVFRWPDDIDLLASSREPLQPDLWFSAFSGPGATLNPTLDHYSPSDLSGNAPAPLMCATEDDIVMPYVSGLPDFRILTAPKIACWHSHLSVIRRVANNEQKVTLVLEDDVDIERDIRQRLASVWGLLPKTWDIVFLGKDGSLSTFPYCSSF